MQFTKQFLIRSLKHEFDVPSVIFSRYFPMIIKNGIDIEL